MKKLVSVLLAVCLVAGIAMAGAVPAAASVPITTWTINGTVVSEPYGGAHTVSSSNGIHIERGGRLIIRGDLFLIQPEYLHIGGRILVTGDIIFVGDAQCASVSGRSWMLHPAWQWVEQYLLFGWLWLWLC